LPTKLVATTTSLEGSKKITSHRSSTAKGLPILQISWKIGPADVEIVGLTEIITNIKIHTKNTYKKSKT